MISERERRRRVRAMGDLDKISIDDTIRVLRLIEYEGPRALVEAQLTNSVNGTRFGMAGKELGPSGFPKERVRITAITLGIWPEVVEEARRTPDPNLIRDLETKLAEAKRVR